MGKRKQLLDNADAKILRFYAGRWQAAENRLRQAIENVARADRELGKAKDERWRCQLDMDSAAREFCRRISEKVDLPADNK